jgi:predicted nucleic acid-binding protein
VIVDANVLFALMKPSSTASRIFELGLEFEAPEFVKIELKKHEGECRTKSGLSKLGFEKRKDVVFSNIRFVAVYEYKRFLKKALSIVDDVDDVPYIALALAMRKPVWSNDSDLKKQDEVVVLTTEEVIKLMS